MTRAIVTVVGKDRVGIIANVSVCLSQMSINVEDISQTILDDYFVMMMLVDLSRSDTNIEQAAQILSKKGKEIGVDIRIQHEDIFNAMHKI